MRVGGGRVMAPGLPVVIHLYMWPVKSVENEERMSKIQK